MCCYCVLLFVCLFRFVVLMCYSCMFACVCLPAVFYCVVCYICDAFRSACPTLNQGTVCLVSTRG